ncbi:MAG TPA: rod shape-determining protein MreD [Chitinophagaceae bacterium]
MTDLVKNTARFVLFLLLQAYVLNNIPPLHQFIVPYLYFLFILWLPFSISRLGLMLIAFIFGLSLDFFTHHPGLHAAPCVLIAYLRPFLLNLLLPQETTELSYVEPSLRSMGWAPYFVYVLILTFMHHAFLVLLEWMQFGNFLFFLGKVTGTTAISIMLIFLTEMLFYRKARYRTNIA